MAADTQPPSRQLEFSRDTPEHVLIRKSDLYKIAEKIYPIMMSTRLSFNLHIVRAQKIHGEILKIYDETVESIDKLKNESAAEQLYLLREANIYADDLNSVVCNLTQVTFKIDKSKHVRRELQHVINILCNMAADIHRSFQRDHEIVKTELKNNIKAAAQVAERLLNIIRSDDIHELKQDLSNNQADVLFAVDRVRLTNLLKLRSPQQMEDLVHHVMDDIKVVLLSLDSKEPNIQQKIIQYSNHSLYKHQGIVNHIQKAIISDHFNDEVKNLFLDVGNELNRYVADMHKIFLKEAELDQLIDDCQKVVTGIVAAFTKIIPLLTTNANEEVADSGMEIIVYIYSYGVSCMYQLLRSLKYVKTDN